VPEDTSWTSVAFPDELVEGEGGAAVASDETQLPGTALEAWRRIGSRILTVTAARPDATVPVNDEFSTPRSRPKHICLGDMMEESLSWVDVDSEDDSISPKHADLMQLAAMQEAQEQAEHAEQPVPPGFEAIARQQRAPGIVEGMPKCLSF
jgi:hypothetical protein